MKRFNWQSGKSYYKVYDGVDNTIKLRKTKFTEYYNQKCLEKFNIEDFENGGLYCLKQQVNDESLLGKKIIISYVDFDLKTGDVIYHRTAYLAALGVIGRKTMALLQILWINAKR